MKMQMRHARTTAERLIVRLHEIELNPQGRYREFEYKRWLKLVNRVSMCGRLNHRKGFKMPDSHAFGFEDSSALILWDMTQIYGRTEAVVWSLEDQKIRRIV